MLADDSVGGGLLDALDFALGVGVPLRRLVHEHVGDTEGVAVLDGTAFQLTAQTNFATLKEKKQSTLRQISI